MEACQFAAACGCQRTHVITCRDQRRTWLFMELDVWRRRKEDTICFIKWFLVSNNTRILWFNKKTESWGDKSKLINPRALFNVLTIWQKQNTSLFFLSKKVRAETSGASEVQMTEQRDVLQMHHIPLEWDALAVWHARPWRDTPHFHLAWERTLRCLCSSRFNLRWRLCGLLSHESNVNRTKLCLSETRKTSSSSRQNNDGVTAATAFDSPLSLIMLSSFYSVLNMKRSVWVSLQDFKPSLVSS